MTRNEYLYELKLLEKTFAAESFVFDNVDWWVVIRIQIASQLHSQLTSKTDDTNIERIEEIVKITEITLKDKAKFILYKNKFKYSKKKVAVFTNSAHMTPVNSQGKKINQYTEPFLKYFKILNLSNDVFDLSLDKLNIENYSFFKMCYHQSIGKKFNNDIEFRGKLRKLSAYFEEKKLFSFSVYNLLKKTIVNNQSTYLTYHLFFKNSKYKAILFYCYYSNVNMAINRAAKNNGIKTIEYQHSLLSDYHYAYARWTTRIVKCEDFFPSSIWVWANEFKLLVESNFKMLKSIEVVDGGNVLHTSLDLISETNTINNIPPHRVKVLITLQGLGLPEFIKKVMVNDSNIFWYVRFHPRYPMDKSEILKLIDLKNNNIDIKIANEAPLQELFQYVDYHITSFSGCAIEAEYFNVKNLIFGEDGYDSYKSKIETGVYKFIDNEDVLKSIFDKDKYLTEVKSTNFDNRTKEVVKRLFDVN